MLRPLIHPDLIRLRDKYPASRCLRDEWPKIKRLIADGKSDEAEAFIKSCIGSNPRLSVRNKVVLSSRSGRREFLRSQREAEIEVKDVLADLSDRVATIVINEAGEDGMISPGRMNRIIGRVKALHTAAWAQVLLTVKAAVREAIRRSLQVNMDAAQDGIDKAKAETEEMEPPAPASFLEGLLRRVLDVAEATRAKIGVGSVIYKTIFDRVKKRQLEKGLFANKFRGQFQSGTTLSRRVWDVRDASLRRLRVTISTGIAQGRAATAIASDIRGQTLAGPLSKTMPRTGPGVYRSAYKNALRMVRTETNNAYVDAQLEYSIQKGYKVLWNLSPGHDEEDECDDLAGKVYDPESVPYPNHPNEACFLTTVLPEIG